MITPFFTVSQDDEYVYIDVKVSHVRFSSASVEMVVDNDTFIFSMAPYYLRLRFPHACVDDERASASFDSPSECVKIKVPKEQKGQFFPDLDLSTKLLARRTALSEADLHEQGAKVAETQPGGSRPLIQELDVENSVPDTQAKAVLEEGEKFSWEISQEQTQEQPELTGNKYGFNNQYDNIVGVSLSAGNDINELGDPESTPDVDRILERLIKENIKFDPEFYAADYIMEKYPSPDDDKMIRELIEWKNPTTRKFLKWYKAQQEKPENEREQIMAVEFSKDEQEKMMNLPRKSYLIDESYKPQLLILLVNLLFSYHFDLRETEGDHNIESAWTVGKITPQICFLDSKISIPNPNNADNVLKSAVVTGVRRALSYPLHRNYNMVLKVWEDVYYNLRGGKRLVLKSLLDLKELFRFHDVYYVYDKIWLEDLCAWLISDGLSEATIRYLAHDLRKEYTSLQKADITFEKVDGSGEDDEMTALDLNDIEVMAEELYHAYAAS
ncbi:SHQ1-domain-containing protein [Suhomyces tanzawaensis NRRL Y-17324]|uniref:SHQ1-domain-containing protein n=1 Tax=Suhomyces tanzawaensis NRRL Y-17324 TaxID=984487 RepID=A0A1E4SAU9_9ASCO|nr:SHQ1-domain-containing protein [Suhomyces tanzawaensis NRRL Y-17324]ODV76634.1 SHQ1-domain-containing protein [Suhomyces tanzawaensis NRRL Y-17324]